MCERETEQTEAVETLAAACIFLVSWLVAALNKTTYW